MATVARKKNNRKSAKNPLLTGKKFDPRVIAVLGVSLIALVGFLLLRLSLAGSALVIPGNYDPPLNAIYVSSDTTAKDTNTGTITAPYATLAKAISATPAGGTIVLRGGTYREGNLSIAKALTLQSYKGEQVWLDGAITQSTGWVADGPAWRLDNSPSSGLCKPSAQACVENAVQVDAAYPMSSSPQMVYRNSTSLKEVQFGTTLTTGTFSYNQASNQLYVADNPSGQTIEITTKRKALNISASGVNLKGIGFRHFGSIESPQKVDDYSFAMVQISGVTSSLVENCVFYQSASRGLFVGSSSNVVIRGNTFQENGMNGVDINKTSGITFEQNKVLQNNAENFSTAAGTYAVIAGSKITGGSGIVRDNIFDANKGTGWWCDLQCDSMTVVRNIMSRNAGHGLYYEVSSNAILASNIIYSNDRSGIQVKGTGVKIFNNTLSQNRQNISIYEDDRSALASENTRDIVIKNNILSGSNGKSPNDVGEATKLLEINGLNYPETVSPSLMVTDLDYNAYFRQTTSDNTKPYFLGWGGKGSYQSATSFAQLQSISGREAHGIGYGGGTNPYFVNEAQSNFVLKTGSPALNTGSALPADIASAIGVTAGSVNFGALKWPSIATPSSTPLPTATPSPTLTPSLVPTATATPSRTPSPTLVPTSTLVPPTNPPIISNSPSTSSVPGYKTGGATKQ